MTDEHDKIEILEYETVTPQPFDTHPALQASFQSPGRILTCRVRFLYKDRKGVMLTNVNKSLYDQLSELELERVLAQQCLNWARENSKGTGGNHREKPRLV